MKEIWAYLGLAHALSWTALIPLIRFHANEELLILGICGPSFAAMLLSRVGASQPDRLRRFLCFTAATLAGWIVLIFTSEWRGTAPHWPVQIKAWLILPALLPAWVISGAFSKDLGIRSLLRTLVHPPNWRWPFIALLSMPIFLLLPSALAHFFGMPLQWPASQSSAGSYANMDGFGRTIQTITGNGTTTVSTVDTQYVPCGCSGFDYHGLPSEGRTGRLGSQLSGQSWNRRGASDWTLGRISTEGM